MSHTKNTVICLSFCTVLAACDNPPTNPTTPGLSEAARAHVQSLSNSWAAKRPLSPDRQLMAAGTINGIIYVVGGHDDRETRSP
jgi:hypothetical protein